MYLAVVEENTRKNIAVGLARAINWDKAEADFSWRFDKSRVLHISIARLTNVERMAVLAACDAQIGPGKVLVS